MNVTELARKLKVTTAELLDILPEFGFDVGKKAIKVDTKIAHKIIDLGSKIREKLETNKLAKIEALKSYGEEATEEIIEKKEVKIPAILSVRDFSQLIDKPVNDVIKELMNNGVMTSLNERIDFETAAIIADEFGVKLILSEDEEIKGRRSEKIKKIIANEEKSDLKSRAPVIVVMGHVDHGKTKLLDTIRTANVVEGEAGGITQHIGAYQVERKKRLITFIDTPGHEAFTAMRSRGAKIADIAILVVAANDSVKPQTVEAIKILQQTEVPMVVAINKIDLPDADIEKVKQDLASMNLTPEDWGGQTITVPISAKENKGIDDLLETILLVSDMEKDKIMANPDGSAVGTIIESHINKGEGPVATVLVQNGTLKLGDKLCIDDVFFGKARNLKDYNNQDIKNAGPSVPVKIIGLKYAPKVGDIVEVKSKIERKHKKSKPFEITKEDTVVKHVFKSENENEDDNVKSFNIILKADVLGSLEVIVESLEKIISDEIKIKVISRGLGNINDNDIDLAESSKGMLIGFNVKATSTAQELANEKNIDLNYYNVIYKLIDEVKEKMTSMLSTEIIKQEIGQLEVLAIFKTENKSMVIGGKVISGKIVKVAKLDVYRQDNLITQGEIDQLQSGKEDVKEVVEGQECGINYVGTPEIEVGDILKVYLEEEKIKTI